MDAVVALQTAYRAKSARAKYRRVKTKRFLREVDEKVIENIEFVGIRSRKRQAGVALVIPYSFISVIAPMFETLL